MLNQNVLPAFPLLGLQGPQQKVRSEDGPSKSAGVWAGTGCATEAAFYFLSQERMRLVSLQFLRTNYLAHLQLLSFGLRAAGAQGWGWFTLPHLFPWPPMQSRASLKEAHKNASSPHTNLNIKGRQEREPKSPNQRQ